MDDTRLIHEPELKQAPCSSARLAVLIDAENVSAELWPRILRLIDRLGQPTVMRAYTCGKPGRWASIPGIEIVDAGEGLAGPNAADFLLAFDAGRLTVSNSADQFVIVSGDDGFASLIQAVQRAGKPTSIIVPVSGNIGDRKSVKVADVTMLVPHSRDLPQPKALALLEATSATNGSTSANGLSSADEAIIRSIVEERSQSFEGWAPLNIVGHDLKARKTVKWSGKLSTFLASLTFLEVRDPKTCRCAVRVRPTG